MVASKRGDSDFLITQIMSQDNQVQILVSFQYENASRLLIHFLMNKGIDVDYLLLANRGGHAVVLKNSAQKEEAIRHTQQFLSAPDHREFQQRAWETGQSIELASSSMFDWLKVRGGVLAVPFTSFILCFCVAVYLASVAGWHWSIFSHLHMQSIGTLADNGQWWRLFGPAFFHFTALHIIFNLLWWWTLGKQIEQTLGLTSLVIIFCVTAVMPNVLQHWASGPNFGGLSGVVYGLFGFVWWLGWLRPQWGIKLPKPIIGLMLIWLIVGYADVLWVSVANTAHTAGLVCGCLLAWIWSHLKSG